MVITNDARCLYLNWETGKVTDTVDDDILKALNLTGYVGVFFAVNGRLLLHTCPVADGKTRGDFVEYPESHDTVWQKEYAHRYNVGYDYYPRGHIVFNGVTGVYKVFCDPCAAAEAGRIASRYEEGECEVSLDEDYQCYMCNRQYIV
jgi:hypothetical protein